MAGTSKDTGSDTFQLLKTRALNVKFDLSETDYSPQENIGIGAYGVVCSAIHAKTQDKVAIKKIPNVFDVKDVAKRTYREIKILKHFNHDNIIHIRDILKPKETLKDFRDVYVVFDLMESDLHRIIYSKQDLSEEHVRYFLYQILRGLKYIHSANVIHRDLKPSNLLVNEDCQLRIGDFGMARGVSSSPDEPNYFMTQYVATRWYRAPEIMLSLVEYGAAVDMWSVGCIFAEMLGRKHLFPGKNYISQIKLIIGILGSPSDDLLQMCHSTMIKQYFQGLGNKEPVPWPTLFPKASRKALNLLSKMLVLNPRDRMSVEQALVHPYLNKYHDPDDEPICVPTFNFDFEKEDLTMEVLREAIHKEVMEYHQPRTPTFSFNAFLRPVPKSSNSSQEDLSQDKQHEQVTHGNLPHGESLPSDTKDSDMGGKSLQQGDVPMINTSTEDSGKRPLSAKNEDNVVRVDTRGHLQVEPNDVEMLSAKRTETQQDVKRDELPVSKENKEPEEKHKTISSDTKALIKAALLNASLKKRHDSVGEEEKPKPVTAAMRQREREEKRNKKKKKQLDRLKKQKEKKGPPKDNSLLTEADREMLQRWADMQQKNVLIAPKPETTVMPQIKPEGATLHIPTGQGPSLVFKQTQINMMQSGNPSIQGLTSVQGVTSVTVAAFAQQPQLGHGEGQQLAHSKHFQTESHNNLQVQSQSHVTGSHSNLAQVQGQTQSNVAASHGNLSQGQGQVQSHVIASQGSLSRVQDQTQMTGSHSNHCQVQGQSHMTAPYNVLPSQDVAEVSQFPGVQEANMPPSSTSVPQQTTSAQNPPNYSQKEYHVDFSTVSVGSLNFLSGNVQNPGVTCQNSIANFSSDSAFTNVTSSHESFGNVDVKSEGNFSAGDSGGFLHQLCSQTSQQYREGEKGLHSSPNASGDHLVPESPPNFQQQGSPHSLHQTSPHSQHGLSPSQQQFSPPHLVEQFPQNFNSDPVISSQGNACTSRTNSTSSFQMRYPHRPPALFQTPDSSSNSNSNSPPLSIDTRNVPLPFSQFQDTQGSQSTSQTVAGAQANSPPDLIALLSQQLSKSNVDDIFPPALALTPRGTGGGYGVGVDLDSFMTSSQEMESHAPEPSPLSSSILADWMEVTGNMNIDLDALEQELQSPMALSYNDLNLYSS